MDKSKKLRREELLSKIEHLESRLAEAEETLRAIRTGEVDAIAIETVAGMQIFTLKNAEQPYRVMVETMNEGAVTLVSDGTILYCNRRFTEMVRTPFESIIGNSIYRFIKPGEDTSLKEYILRVEKGDRMEISLQSADGAFISVLLSMSGLDEATPPSICLLATDITEQKLTEKMIKASLLEKETMLKEIYHRVRNNLQIISGLLQLQAKASNNPELIESLQESRNRIHAMATVHEKLYSSSSFSEIDLIAYIKTLSQELFQSYNINIGNININIHVDGEILVNISKAIPCGLIMNELISNALKHAFPGDRPGELNISICKTKENEIEIIVSDNGLGIPDAFDIHNPRSMGLDLVNGLVKNQLDGQIELIRDNGTKVRMIFPL